jgi:hypothetical protein
MAPPFKRIAPVEEVSEFHEYDEITMPQHQSHELDTTGDETADSDGPYYNFVLTQNAAYTHANKIDTSYHEYI